MNEFCTELVDSSDAALAAKDINLAILDADISDPSIEFLYTKLLEKDRQMGIIIIHSFDQSIELSANAEKTFRSVSRPFDFPTLLLAIREILDPDALARN